MTSDSTRSSKNKVANLRAINSASLTLLVERTRGQLKAIHGKRIQTIADELREWERLTTAKSGVSQAEG